MIKSPRFYVKMLFPVVVGATMLFFPLLGDFHFESAILAALIGTFWAGACSCRKRNFQGDFRNALRISGYLYLAALPLLIHALLTGCFSVDGLAFWILYPMPSVFFGYSIGRLLKSWHVKHACFYTVAILVAIGGGIFLYEFFNYPQLFFYNHVWGGWPGPIYDETVEISGSVLFFRTLTVLWAAFLWHIPLLGTDRYSKWIITLSAIALTMGYMQLAEWGVVTPRSYLKQELRGHRVTEHFDIYYDPEFYTGKEIKRYAAEHEFFYDQISERLNIHEKWNSRIESYLYAHPWQKKELVGAKYTSYVPIWLEQDQIHIAKPQLENSLKHELVHVLSKRFGNQLFNGSWSIGLIEGLAVAIAGSSSPVSTVDQIVVSAKPYPDATELINAFSFSGFYSGRSGVNYTTSGSFVKFLINNYPIRSLKNAYRTGSIKGAYQNNWETLVEKWHQHLNSVTVDSIDQKAARKTFSIPSLFEQKCPHVVSDFAKSWDRYQYYMASSDTSEALESLDRALLRSDSTLSVKKEWSFRNLEQNHPEKVQQAASLADTSAELQLLYADAFALTGERKRAKKYLRRGQELFVENPDSLLEPAIVSRLDSRQWQIYRDMTYKNMLPDSSSFSVAYYRTKIRSIDKALKLDRFDVFIEYVRQLADLPYQLRYFDAYQQMINHIAFIGEVDLANGMIEEIDKLPLREKYRQRLEREREWIKFLGDS